MKVARVAFTDLEGIEHAVTVEAGSLYHAIGMAIARFRASSLKDPGAAATFVVQPQEALPEHKATRQQFEAWLAREGVASPAETFQRNTLRDLLKETPPSSDSRKRKPWH